MKTVTDYFTILEIGSGSFKLHREHDFSERFQSSLGKAMNGLALAPASLEIAFNSVEQEIIPFLEEREIALKDVLVFATAAIRKAMNDPAGSGQAFIDKLHSYGFTGTRVFSEDDECEYAAKAVVAEFDGKLQDFSMLDTGGASHQLVQVREAKITTPISIPLGSHHDLAKETLPDFRKLGFKEETNLVLIGTSALLLSTIADISLDKLKTIVAQLQPASLEERREILQSLIDESLWYLLVDFRLAILPNAFALVENCAENLGTSKFIFAQDQAMNLVSRSGF